MTNREDGYMTTRCTPWQSYDVPTIWSTVSDEGDAVSYLQVTAWRETSEAIDRHAATLRAARDELMAAWPPDKSAAAQEFLDQVDSALSTMKYHSGIAAVNSEALHGIVTTLDDTKSKAAVINNEWTARSAAQKKESTFDHAVDNITFWSDEDAWKADLKQKMVRVMVASDATIAERREQMQAAAPYIPSKDRFIKPDPGQGNDTYAGGTTGGSRTEAPSIAPLAALTAIGAIAPTATITAATQWRSPSGGSSEDAATAIEGLNNKFSNKRAPLEGVVDPTGRIGKLGLANPAVDHIRSGAARLDGGAEQPSSLIGREGIIGASPTPERLRTNSAQAAEHMTGDSNLRVNQMGGIISGEPGRNTTADNRRPSRPLNEPSFDPDDPWIVEEGGRSVIAGSQRTHLHLPGPGVLGIDR